MTPAERLAQERRARMAAERHLEWKSRELAAANEKLALQARALSELVVEERQSARAAQSEAARLKGQNERYLGDLDRAHTTAVMAERRLRTSIDIIRDGFAVFDAENRLLLANRAWMHPFAEGTLSPGMAYRDLLAAVAPLFRLEQDAESWIDAMCDRIEGDEIPPVELALQSGRWIRLEDRRARDGDRVSLAIDITAEMRLRAAVEAIPDGFVIFDNQDRLIMCNQRYRDLYALSQELIRPGTRFEALLRSSLANGLHADALGREEAWITERLAEYRAASGAVEQRFTDGRWIRAQDHVTPDGGRVGLRSDITPERVTQETLLAARAAAEAANRAKSAFLANMSHEIRTPMNGVVGMAELLCGTDLTEEQRLFAETIRSSGEALLTIINDILDYSKIEAGHLALRPEPFDLERLIHETAILLQPQARAKGIELLTDYDMFLPTRLVGDPGRLRQVLTNLMGNAVKFTQTGHVLVRVVGIQPFDGTARLHITVEDTGIGIAPDHLERIFDEFTQVDDAADRRYEGTGLGLAITRRLITRMEGEIWVESEPGSGSCFGFTLTLPVAEEALPPRVPTSLRSLLLCAGNPTNRTIIERQLAPFGIDLTTCRSGDEALDRALSGADAAILVDHGADSLDGLALCRTLSQKGAALPRVVMVTPDQVPEAEAARQAGIVQEILVKPVLRADLYRALTRQTGSTIPLAAALQTRRMRVLAAEDNKTNQLVLAKMVRDLDLDLRFADNGRQSVEVWQDFHPDLIFMDISMPELDGCAASSEIRRIESGRARVPIIALTAHAMEDDGVRFLAAGIDRHLTKPLRKSALVEVLLHFCPPDAVLGPVAAQSTAA
jgi:signal transduction histidine kinase/CheY-like chemotaxis protein